MGRCAPVAMAALFSMLASIPGCGDTDSASGDSADSVGTGSPGSTATGGLAATTTSGAADSESSADTALSSDSTGDPGCHDVVNAAPVHDIVSVAEGAPAAAGGEIAVGTYFRTATVRYVGPNGTPGPTGSTWQETLRYDGALWEVAFDSRGNSGRFSFAVDFAGTELALGAVCPGRAPPITSKYSVVDRATFLVLAANGTEAWTYERVD